MKCFFKIIIILLLSILFSISVVACRKNIVEKIFLPHTQDGYDISQGYLSDLNTKYLNYKTHANFPAKNVIDFYNNFFRNNSFISYSDDGYGKSIWENYNYKSGSWELSTEPPARYISTWIDKDKKVRIVLFLLFKGNAGNAHQKNKNLLLIELKATNFFDSRKISGAP